MEKFFTEQPGGGFGNFGVLAPVVIFCPAIEMKMDNGGFRLWALDFGLLLTNIGPVSRVQPRLVGCVTNCIFRKSKTTFSKTWRANCSSFSCRTIRRMFSPAEIFRTIS